LALRPVIIMQDSLQSEPYPLEQLSNELESSANARTWNFARRFCIMVAIILLLCVGIIVIRSGLHGWSAYHNGTQLLALVQRDPQGDDLPKIQTLLESTTTALNGLDDVMWFWSPILERLSWLPQYGPTLAAAPEFVVAGSQFANLAIVGLPVVQPLFADDKSLTASLSEMSITDLTTLFSEHEAEFVQMAEQATVANQALAGLDAAALHPKLADPVSLGQMLLPLFAPGLRSLPYVDGLVGRDAPQTYLVLVQNNDELRATGGFITAVGRLVLKDGGLDALKFTDSYWVQRDDVEYPGAPRPMQQYMGVQLMLLRDANWSPDLPTTAKTIKAIYRQDTGIDIDGVITVDMNALSLIVNALSPLTLAGVDEPLTGETIVAQIKRLWDEPIEPNGTSGFAEGDEWWMQRKDFVPALADAVLARATGGDIDYVALLGTMVRALDERAVQLWIDEPHVGREVRALGWDGAVDAPEHSDFIGLVDSNLGYNKVDTVLERSIAYHVEWPTTDLNLDNIEATSSGVATLSVTYRHPVEVAEHRCRITPRYGRSYDEMTARCYFNYVRLYVPADSELIALDGVLESSVTSRRGEGGTQVFAGYFVLEPGKENVLTFTYRLPERIQPPAEDVGYPLVVRRQSGTRPLSIVLDVGGRSLSVTVSKGTRILSVY